MKKIQLWINFIFLKMLPLPPLEIKYSFCITNIYNLAASVFLGFFCCFFFCRKCAFQKIPNIIVCRNHRSWDNLLKIGRLFMLPSEILIFWTLYPKFSELGCKLLGPQYFCPNTLRLGANCSGHSIFALTPWGWVQIARATVFLP